MLFKQQSTKHHKVKLVRVKIMYRPAESLVGNSKSRSWHETYRLTIQFSNYIICDQLVWSRTIIGCSVAVSDSLCRIQLILKPCSQWWLLLTGVSPSRELLILNLVPLHVRGSSLSQLSSSLLMPDHLVIFYQYPQIRIRQNEIQIFANQVDHWSARCLKLKDDVSSWWIKFDYWSCNFCALR